MDVNVYIFVSSLLAISLSLVSIKIHDRKTPYWNCTIGAYWTRIDNQDGLRCALSYRCTENEYSMGCNALDGKEIVELLEINVSCWLPEFQDTATNSTVSPEQYG